MIGHPPMLESTLPKDAPFMIEPVEAWRTWRVDLSRSHRGPFLRSSTFRVPWPERRPIHAHCISQFRAAAHRAQVAGVGRHECPDNVHRCGIYALREESDMPRWAMTPGYVGGRVKLWGRVYVYEKGYIAEYAYPMALTYRLDPTTIDDEVGHMLGESYGIEVNW